MYIMFHIQFVIYHRGCPKKNKTRVFLNILATKYRILNRFFPLKTEIHTQILNTKPFLCDIRGGEIYKIKCSSETD